MKYSQNETLIENKDMSQIIITEIDKLCDYVKEEA